MASICLICKSRVLSHSLCLSCAHCSKQYNLKCLPYVDKKDPLFTERHLNNWFCILCLDNLFPFNHLTDNSEHLEAISEIWCNLTIYGIWLTFEEFANYNKQVWLFNSTLVTVEFF